MTENNSKIASVLVVDDEQIVLSLVEDTLTDEGYNITTTESTDEAVELAKKQYYDFLLTDIRMPGKNGIELARELRLIIPDIGVIFMTGYANLDTAKQAIKEGAYDYLMKPFELSELRLAMARAVEKKEADSAAALSKELNKIADLSNLMYASGDLASLLCLSLSFAILQSKADAGIAVYLDYNGNEATVIREDKSEVGNEGISVIPFSEKDHSFISLIREPKLIKSIEDHPLGKTAIFEQNKNDFLPKRIFDSGKAIVVPMIRSDKLIGLLTLFHNKSGDELQCTDSQLLNFISSQLAISLENLQLLEESRRALKRLEYLQDQAIQMEKMATRGKMSAEIGHELNNYLGVVVGNFQLMDIHLQKGITEGLGRFTVSIHDHLDKISHFTKSLMDYSSGKGTNFAKVDINALLNRIVEFLIPQKRFREFELIVTTDTDMLEAEIDNGLIEQLLYNLLNNASDASENTEIKKIDISTSKTDDENIRISIKDYGSGIPEDKIKMLFKEKFTTKETGHGIGLTVCKNIIDKHRGSIAVNSSVGMGTEFIISLPIHQVAPGMKQMVTL